MNAHQRRIKRRSGGYLLEREFGRGLLDLIKRVGNQYAQAGLTYKSNPLQFRCVIRPVHRP